MIHAQRFLVPLLMAAAALPGRAQMSPISRPWPAGVQPVNPRSPALSPEDALKSFYMPPGYRVELVASEPLIQDPIMMDWDNKGRLWVVEMNSYIRDLKFPEPNLTPTCKIVVLEDTHHTGRMDKSTVFADGLVLPRTVKVLDSGVLVAEPPYVWLMHDKDGDLHMHTKELVTADYGRREMEVEGNANDLEWTMDNWMNTSLSTIRIRYKHGKFEIAPTLSRGEWGLSQDDYGRIYRNSNESPVHFDYVPTHYFARNPNLLRMSGSDTILTDEENEQNFVIWPVRPNPGTNRAYQFGIDRKDGSIVKFTSACGPLIYRGDQLPSELYGNLFVAEPAANVVSRFVLTPTAGGWMQARKAYPKGEFLASTDERFRPVYLSNAPDGSLYIVDMYRGIIQQKLDITQYLRSYILKTGLQLPIHFGRIYRVVHDDTLPKAPPHLFGASTDTLVAALSSPNGWTRDRAQEMIVEHDDRSAIPGLLKLTADADPRRRIQALWTLDGIDGIDIPTVAGALTDESAQVRAAAVRISERWLGEAGNPVAAEVLKRVGDSDPAVWRQLGASLGSLPAGAREEAAARLLEKHANDPIVMDATLSSLNGLEGNVLEKLLAIRAETPQLKSALTMLVATIIKSGREGDIQKLFAWTGDKDRPEWQRSALLEGSEVALLGAKMPDTIETRRSLPPGSPCATCPGGRAGPGGGYAFVGPPRRANGQPALHVGHEPPALSELASQKDSLGVRAAAVLARVIWPGKAGVVAVRPLTAGEQKRFDAGREVYRNICQVCHQPDGRGKDHVAANLIGSELALAPPQVTARILFNGKEGTIGLMPPIGAALTDEQIADVLTYVRREWGQTGTPVDPETVRETRAAAASRNHPWTNSELLALAARINAGKPAAPAAH